MAAITAACADTGANHERVDGGKPHGTDGDLPHLDADGVNLAAAAEHGSEGGRPSYSARKFWFWSDYRGPCLSLGVVGEGGPTPVPGPRPCPEPVGAVFTPLFEAVENDHLPRDRLVSLAEVGAHHLTETEKQWLAGLFAASEGGVHDPADWDPEDRHRRAALRILGRSAVLFREHPDRNGDRSWEQAFRATVAYGDTAVTDPVLRAHPQALGW